LLLLQQQRQLRTSGDTVTDYLLLVGLDGTLRNEAVPVVVDGEGNGINRMTLRVPGALVALESKFHLVLPRYGISSFLSRFDVGLPGRSPEPSTQIARRRRGTMKFA
jgi:hypothetical protein